MYVPQRNNSLVSKHTFSVQGSKHDLSQYDSRMQVVQADHQDSQDEMDSLQHQLEAMRFDKQQKPITQESRFPYLNTQLSDTQQSSQNSSINSGREGSIYNSQMVVNSQLGSIQEESKSQEQSNQQMISQLGFMSQADNLIDYNQVQDVSKVEVMTDQKSGQKFVINYFCSQPLPQRDLKNDSIRKLFHPQYSQNSNSVTNKQSESNATQNQSSLLSQECPGFFPHVDSYILNQKRMKEYQLQRQQPLKPIQETEKHPDLSLAQSSTENTFSQTVQSESTIYGYLRAVQFNSKIQEFSQNIGFHDESSGFDSSQSQVTGPYHEKYSSSTEFDSQASIKYTNQLSMSQTNDTQSKVKLSQVSSSIMNQAENAESQITVMYSTQNSNASALKVTQIQKILTDKDGKRTLKDKKNLDKVNFTNDAFVEINQIMNKKGVAENKGTALTTIQEFDEKIHSMIVNSNIPTPKWNSDSKKPRSNYSFAECGDEDQNHSQNCLIDCQIAESGFCTVHNTFHSSNNIRKQAKKYPLDRKRRVKVLLEHNQANKERFQIVRDHIKFPLYTDEEIGFTEELLKDQIHQSHGDEDCDSDDDVMEKCDRLCKRDLVDLVRLLNKKGMKRVFEDYVENYKNFAKPQLQEIYKQNQGFLATIKSIHEQNVAAIARGMSFPRELLDLSQRAVNGEFNNNLKQWLADYKETFNRCFNQPKQNTF
eukprot:403353905